MFIPVGIRFLKSVPRNTLDRILIFIAFFLSEHHFPRYIFHEVRDIKVSIPILVQSHFFFII